MEKKKLLRCPYCGRRVGYFKALLYIGQGEYTCDKCKRYCNIKYSPIIYLLLFIAAFLGCLFGFVLFRASFKGVLLALVPFIVLYLLIPLTFVMTEVKFRQKSDKNENTQSLSGINFERRQEGNTNSGRRQPRQEIRKSAYPAGDKVKTYIPKKSEIAEPDGSTKYIPDIETDIYRNI